MSAKESYSESESQRSGERLEKFKQIPQKVKGQYTGQEHATRKRDKKRKRLKPLKSFDEYKKKKLSYESEYHSKDRKSNQASLQILSGDEGTETIRNLPSRFTPHGKSKRKLPKKKTSGYLIRTPRFSDTHSYGHEEISKDSFQTLSGHEIREPMREVSSYFTALGKSKRKLSKKEASDHPKSKLPSNRSSLLDVSLSVQKEKEVDSLEEEYTLPKTKISAANQSTKAKFKKERKGDILGVSFYNLLFRGSPNKIEGFFLHYF